VILLLTHKSRFLEEDSHDRLAATISHYQRMNDRKKLMQPPLLGFYRPQIITPQSRRKIGRRQPSPREQLLILLSIALPNFSFGQFSRDRKI
jgi:hypothetical protein